VVSAAKMSMVGIVPGLVFGLALMILNHRVSRRGQIFRKIAEAVAGPVLGGQETVKIGKSSWDVIFALVMHIIILGGIYAGIFTPPPSRPASPWSTAS
jgi:C4-dicarboxylate transporter DctM subunit